jgi:cob(I)alamin adenosyltransferase
MHKGLIHIYTGNGKGKTTAAVGVSLRAKSRGMRTLFAQFFKEKGSDATMSLLQDIGVETIVFTGVKSPFFNPDMDRSRIRDEVKKALARIEEIFSEDRFDIIVLDEFICLISEGVLTEEEALEFLKKKPNKLEVVLTGKGATEGIIEFADYVTYMKKIKHPYEKKLAARKGIEF